MLNSVKLMGAGALLASALIYATFGLLVRELSGLFGDNAQTAARLFLAALIIIVVNLFGRRVLKISKKELFKIILLGIACACTVLLFTISANQTKIANSVFLLYAGSIMSALLIGTLFLKEKLTMNKILAIVLALIGVFMYSDAFLAVTVGVAAGFVSGLFDGICNALRKMLRTSNRNVVLMYQYGIGAVFAAVLMLISGEQIIREVSLMPIIVTVLFAILLLLVGNLLLYGFQHFDVNAGTVILSLELLFAMVLGYLFLQETPSANELAGGVFIFIASVMTVLEPGELLRGLMRRGKLVR